MKNKIEKHTKSVHNLSYIGDIHIQVIDDDRIYYDKYFHNTGTTKLFNFLVDCLVGNYSVAKSSRPCKVILFKKLDSEVFPSEATVNNELKLVWNTTSKISNAVYYDSTATPGVTSNGGSIEYHFRIPFLALEGGATIRKIGLYPNNIVGLEQDLCAYYLFDGDGPFIEVPEEGGNFTIIVN